jgi:hypothetical protein
MCETRILRSYQSKGVWERGFPPSFADSMRSAAATLP